MCDCLLEVLVVSICFKNIFNRNLSIVDFDAYLFAASLIMVMVVMGRQQFLAVFDVVATAAGSDIAADAETCDTNAAKKLNNPNTTLMLNCG